MHANFDARYINLFGVVFGLPTHHIASYAIKFFIKDDDTVPVLQENYSGVIASPEDAIREMQNLAAEGSSEKA